MLCIPSVKCLWGKASSGWVFLAEEPHVLRLHALPAVLPIHLFEGRSMMVSDHQISTQRKPPASLFDPLAVVVVIPETCSELFAEVSALDHHFSAQNGTEES